MKEDVCLAANVWHNLYTAVDEAVGTGLLIYSKTGATVLVWGGANQPGVDDRHGVPFNDQTGPITVDEGSLGCWVYSAVETCLSVQVYE